MAEQKQITIVVGLILDNKGQLLLARRHQPQNPEIHGKWELPGGGIDFGEEATESLKREIKEETGLKVEPVKLLPKIISKVENFKGGNKLHVIILTYICKIVGGKLELGLDDEIAELKFVPPNEVKKYQAFSNVDEVA